jgi:hypothetical protein
LSRKDIRLRRGLSRGKNIEHPWKQEIVLPESSRNPFLEVFRPERYRAQHVRARVQARPQIAGADGQIRWCVRARLFHVDFIPESRPSQSNLVM